MTRNIMLRGAFFAVVAVAVVAGAVVGINSINSAEAAPETKDDPVQQTAASNKLELLHQRQVARTSADADDDDSTNPALSDMTPEQAATLAQRGAGGGKVTWIARRTDGAGKPYYRVDLDTRGRGGPPDAARNRPKVSQVKHVHVDARTHAVSDGSNDPSGPDDPTYPND